MTTRIPIPPERIAPSLHLLPDEQRYLLYVLRMAVGDELEVFDGLGGRFPARLVQATADDAVLELGERIPDEEGGVSISIAPALIKNDRLDWVVEKATELGAAAILPWEGKNCIVHLDAKKGQERQERWRKIAASAARQCGRASIPDIEAPGKLERLVAQSVEKGELCVVLYERESSRSFSALVKEAEATPTRPILVVTGPEGGFTEEEIRQCVEKGAVTATIGRRILRAETAPIASIAAARAVRGEM